jgi:DNA polymerase III subunit delta'
MKFSEITGQIRIKNHLIKTVRNNRVSHSQLFTGPQGCGKLALAIAYAQYICCENKQVIEGSDLAGDSCGLCPSCVKYNKLAHPDLHFFYPVAPTTEIKKPISSDYIGKWRELLIQNNYMVDLLEWYDKMGLENKQGIINAEDCNEMIRLLGYKAYESEYKVVIIWFAEKLFHAAAPKLLKILEEPSDKTLLLLICENTDLMLNTILSRTQIVKIPKFTDRDIVNELSSRFGSTEAVSRKIAVLCDGNMKFATNLLAETENEDYNFTTLQAWLRLCYQGKVIEIQNFTEEISKIGRERQKSLLSYALRVTRRCLLLNLHLESLVKLEGEENNFVVKLSPFINPANGDMIAQEFNKAIFHIERNANAKILFMDLSLQLIRLLKITA